jgi:hypothetical protein
MLTIRKSQIEELAKSKQAYFVKRMVSHLKQNFSRQLTLNNIPEEDLSTIVIKGIEKAAYFNVINEGDIRLYLECMALLGPGFDKSERHPWAGEILNQAGLTGEEKMDRISEHLTFL